jgi:uncharacterized protein (TIGR02594 family)
MKELPKVYQWLLQERGPRMLLEALRLYGTLEQQGSANNPAIMAWAKEVGEDVSKIYWADSVPWCGLAMALIAKRSGYDPPHDPLWALNWGSFGQHAPNPMLGDVLTFIRTGSDGKRAGHVTLYIGEDDRSFHCLGGNQSDAFNITTINKTRLYQARRPIFKIGQPENVRRIYLRPTGQQTGSLQ